MPSDSDTESNHRLIHQSVVPEGKGISKIALDDSSDDDSLTVHSRHGSEIDSESVFVHAWCCTIYTYTRCMYSSFSA